MGCLYISTDTTEKFTVLLGLKSSLVREEKIVIIIVMINILKIDGT